MCSAIWQPSTTHKTQSLRSGTCNSFLGAQTHQYRESTELPSLSLRQTNFFFVNGPPSGFAITNAGTRLKHQCLTVQLLTQCRNCPALLQAERGLRRRSTGSLFCDGAGHRKTTLSLSHWATERRSRRIKKRNAAEKSATEAELNPLMPASGQRKARPALRIVTPRRTAGRQGSAVRCGRPFCTWRAVDRHERVISTHHTLD